MEDGRVATADLTALALEPDGFEYCPELEAEDPFFNRATQAEIARRIRDVEIRGEGSLIDFDPTVEL